MPLNIGQYRTIDAGQMGSTLAHHLAFAVELANLVTIAIAETGGPTSNGCRSWRVVSRNFRLKLLTVL